MPAAWFVILKAQARTPADHLCRADNLKHLTCCDAHDAVRVAFLSPFLQHHCTTPQPAPASPAADEQNVVTKESPPLTSLYSAMSSGRSSMRVGGRLSAMLVDSLLMRGLC